MQKEVRQCVITDSLTKDTKKELWGGLTFYISGHQPVNDIMNYYDGREHFGASDMLLRFYGCWKEQKYGALILQFVCAVHSVIVWETAPSYSHSNDVHRQTLSFM